MKRKNIYVISLILMGYMLIQGGCVKEDFDVIPKIEDTSSLIPSMTIAELKSISNLNSVEKVGTLITPSLWQTIKDRNTLNKVSDLESVVIEGYVTTSDSTGNFYEAFTLQDETAGIEVKVNSKKIYEYYRIKPGQKVLIKVKDLYLGYYRGTYQLGAGIVELGLNKIAGIPSNLVYNFIERSGWRKSLTPETITITGIAPSHYQKLVCFEDVQFKVPANKFSDLGENSNRTLIDCNGNIIFIRTSGFSMFADKDVPTGKGKIVGILTKYVNSDNVTYTDQLVIRDLNDIKFDQPQCSFNVPTPNTTIAALKAMCTSNYKDIIGNIVISGIVTGNDESGNIYKQINLQDETGGITFSVNITGLYPEFPVGTRIIVNCDGLCIGKYGGQIQLGMPTYTTYVQRLDPITFFSKVFANGTKETVNPILTTINGITDNLVNKVITIENVQFITSDLGKTWSDPFATTNRYIEDIFGNKLLIRTSNYANFANVPIPPLSGNITAVLTKYNSEYQLLVRKLEEANFNKPRFNFKLTQDFNSASIASPITIGGWQSIAQTGTRNWLGQSSSMSGATHYYAEMNADGSGSNNTAWLISPQVNLSGMASKTLFFQTAYNTWTGNGTLEVLISTNFNGTDVTSATWTPVSGAIIAKQTDAANTWVGSGNIDINQYTGNIHLAFKYTSTGGGAATAFRVDNVKIY